MVVRMARGFARLEFPSTYTMLRDSLLLLELVNARTAQETSEVAHTNSVVTNKVKPGEKTITELLEQAPADLSDRFEALKAFLLALGDDVQMKVLKIYFAFRRIKNFACVEVHPPSKRIIIYVKIDPASIQLEKDFTRDVRSIGHNGTGDLEITLHNDEDIERAKPLLLKSYETN